MLPIHFLKRSTWITTALMLTVPFLVYAMVSWYDDHFEELPVFGKTDVDAKGRIVPHQVADFSLINQDEKSYGSSDLQDKIMVANFFFTSCPTICPSMMKNMQAVQTSFLNDRNIRFVSFTVDPSRDSPKRLKWYCTKFNVDNSNWNLITGDKREIYRLARKSFYLSADDGDGGENDFIHSDQLVLVDIHKHIRGYYDGLDTRTVAQLIHDVKKLKNEK